MPGRAGPWRGVIGPGSVGVRDAGPDARGCGPVPGDGRTTVVRASSPEVGPGRVTVVVASSSDDEEEGVEGSGRVTVVFVSSAGEPARVIVVWVSSGVAATRPSTTGRGVTVVGVDDSGSVAASDEVGAAFDRRFDLPLARDDEAATDAAP